MLGSSSARVVAVAMAPKAASEEGEHRRTKYEFGEGEFLSFGNAGPVGPIGHSPSIKDAWKDLTGTEDGKTQSKELKGMCNLVKDYALVQWSAFPHNWQTRMCTFLENLKKEHRTEAEIEAFTWACACACARSRAAAARGMMRCIQPQLDLLSYHDLSNRAPEQEGEHRCHEQQLDGDTEGGETD